MKNPELLAPGSIENLRIFDLVIMEGLLSCTSFRELARRLKTDPQNLTRRIAYLEKVLGIRLVERSVEGFTLNEMGRATIDKVAQILKEINKLKFNPNEQGLRRLRFCSRGFLVDYFIESLKKINQI